MALGSNFLRHIAVDQYVLDTPYYLGNALAVDFLRMQTNEMLDATDTSEALQRDYSILSAGCGNLRNLIYTITSLPDEFMGSLRVTLNDIDPFVQARNVLFLFMMQQDDPDVASKITTIWYSLHLPDDVYKILMESLTKLCTIDEHTLKESTYGMVEVSSDALDILRQVWQGWMVIGHQKPSWRVMSLSQQRTQMIKDDPDSAVGLETFKE